MEQEEKPPWFLKLSHLLQVLEVEQPGWHTCLGTILHLWFGTLSHSDLIWLNIILSYIEHLLWDYSAELDWLPVLAHHLVEEVLSVYVACHAVEISILKCVTVAVSNVSKLAFLSHKGNVFRFGFHHLDKKMKLRKYIKDDIPLHM